MVALARRIAEDGRFQAFVMAVIVGNAILVGLETSDEMVAAYGGLMAVLDVVITAIFIVEIAIRLLARWPRPQDFFRDGWNVFDFVVVALSLLPAVGTFATVARLARLLRVLRLISAFPELRLIVGTMLRSVRSMAHIILLTVLLMYVYAVLGYHLFHEVDPVHWGSLSAAFITLFQVLTLEGWVELQEVGMSVGPLVVLYYASYVLVAVFVIVNLFIAVVLNNLETVKAEHAAEGIDPNDRAALLGRVTELRTELEAFEHALRREETDRGL